MQTVATFLNREEAHIAHSFLQANGIEALVADSDTFSVIPHVGLGTGGYRLMVADEDRHAADTLLASVNRGETAFHGEHLEDTPRSGSSRPLLIGGFALASIFLWYEFFAR